ncbi:chorismate-binding protein [Candidatus Vidania fulgoroideorum]
MNKFIKLIKSELFCYFNYEISYFCKKKDMFNICFLKRKIIFDKKEQKIIFFFLIKKNKIHSFLFEINKIFSLINKKPKKRKILFKFNFFNKKNKYLINFKKIKKMIKYGEIMQLQLSKKIILKNFYSIKYFFYFLIKNISNYIFYFKNRGISLLGNSPETFIKNYKNFYILKPIAGTIYRGEGIINDKFLERKLFFDKKENKEHNMLIDLSRNDMNFINCKNKRYLNVRKIEKYSYVQHIVSKIKGFCGGNFYVNIKKLMPSGTLTGTPKIKAISLINKVENLRKYYGGGIGFFIKKDNFNFAILIRSLFLKNKCIKFQAASGIVKDSKFRLEMKELENKLKSFLMCMK